jgi:eukaryotic-like serine/threonine-protein kinase
METWSPERWRAVGPHFERALEVPLEERSAWLAAVRAEDPTLARDLEVLLEEHRALEREGFLETSALPPPGKATLAGQALGAYTLVSPIGQGGMGSVWLAKRSDGRFEGAAAVKLLSASLMGRAGEERFRREGSILARLHHPHIAQLLDAGVSPWGQPYLVLEYVEGERIDTYCDGEKLSVEARLRLFLSVLDAVALAHANLIVHRDIKPSNVLVAKDGGVKLLDFGIAKLLEAETGAGEATALTRDGGHALTPEYAAPEQVTGGAVTTATDVYALGVLLYVLLSGRHPAEDTLGTPADLLRSIVDTEPRRISEMAASELQRRQLRGDLDTIVAKALKKQPEERYPSVTALGEDIRRYLRHEPIAARPDTLAYRARKFVQRNRVAVTLSALAILALCGGLVGTLTQARRATRHAAAADAQRRRADQEARLAGEQRDFAMRQLSRAEAINDLNAFLLSDAAPSGRPFTARELLERAERIVDRQQADTRENRAEMLIAIGSLYGSRDEEAKAREVLTRAYALARETTDPSIRAKAASQLAGEVAAAAEFDRAESLIREALTELGDAPQFALQRVSVLLRASYVADVAGDSPASLERALTARRILNESRQGSPLLELRVAMSVAEAYRMAGRNREAAVAFEETFDRLSALGRDETERAGTILNNWGLAVHILGHPLEAERLFRRAIAIGSADASERNVSPMLLNNLARVLNELARFLEARRYAERAYAEARKAGDEIVVNQTLSVRFGIAIEEHDPARAAAILDELGPRWKRMMPPDHIAFAVLPIYEAQVASELGEHTAAVAKADRAIVLAEANEQGLDYLPTFLLRRAAVNLRARRFERAGEDARRALELERKATGDDGTYSGVGRAYLMLGRALDGQGKREEARSAFESALRQLESSLGSEHPMTLEARRGAAPGGPAVAARRP